MLSIVLPRSDCHFTINLSAIGFKFTMYRYNLSWLTVVELSIKGETAMPARALSGKNCGSRFSRTPGPIAKVEVSFESSRPGPLITVTLTPLRGPVAPSAAKKRTTSGLVDPLQVEAAETRARSTPIVVPFPKTPRSPKSLRPFPSYSRFEAPFCHHIGRLTGFFCNYFMP